VIFVSLGEIDVKVDPIGFTEHCISVWAFERWVRSKMDRIFRVIIHLYLGFPRHGNVMMEQSVIHQRHNHCF
jgi:hypothetical protein